MDFSEVLMRNVNCAIVASILFGASGFLWCNQIVSAAPENNVDYTVRGSRNVKVRIAKRSEYYNVTVSMIGVTVFDASTNRSLSLLKAKQYTFAVLGKHLSPGNLKKGLRFTVQGLTSHDTSLTGSAFSTTYRIPLAGVKWEKVVTGKPGNAETPIEAIPFIDVPKGNLLTRPQDLAETLQLVFDSHVTNGALSNNNVFDLEDDEFQKLLDVEINNFGALLEKFKKIVDNDKLLLGREKEDLQEQAERLRKPFAVFVEHILIGYEKGRLK
jgi:hypothetical protein